RVLRCPLFPRAWAAAPPGNHPPQGPPPVLLTWQSIGWPPGGAGPVMRLPTWPVIRIRTSAGLKIATMLTGSLGITNLHGFVVQQASSLHRTNEYVRPSS